MKDQPNTPILNIAIDLRSFRGFREKAVQEELEALTHPGNPEFVESGKLIEHMTMRAALAEKRLRFNMPQVCMVPPSVAISQLADPSGIAADHGGENKKYINELKSCALVCIVVYSEPSRHYTYLELRADKSLKPPWQVTYKDSLQEPSEQGIEVAKRLLLFYSISTVIVVIIVTIIFVL